MIDLYEGILPAYSRDINKARELRDKLTKFYKELDLKIPIKIQDSLGQPIETKTLDITKDGITCGTYLTFLYRFIENDFEHCQLFSDDNQKYEHLLNKSSNGINTFEDLLNRINKPENGETINEETKKYYIDCVQKYRNNVSKITKLYFNKEIDYSGKLAPDYIAKTNECILLKAETKYDDQTYASTPPVKIKLFSNTSKISSEVILKKSVIAKGYCAVFGNNNANLWPVVDSPNMQKESIAIAKAESGFPSLQSLYDNQFFKNKLGFGSINFPNNDYAKSYYKFTANLLCSGGVETVKTTYNGIEIYLLVKNQADWIVFSGHGNPKTGSIGTYDPKGTNPNAIIITPGKDKLDVSSKTIVPGLIRVDGTSKYDEDVDVLILNSCGVLNTIGNIKAWHNVLPKGIILGYNVDIDSGLAANIILRKFDALLTDSGGALSFNRIGNKWCDYNREISESYGYINVTSGRYYNAFYTFIYEDLCYLGGRKEYKNWLGITCATDEFTETIISLK